MERKQTQHINNNDNTVLTGPIVQPKSGQVEHVAVLLHGYGSSGDDFAWGVRRLASLIPNTVFLTPNAPHPCEKEQARSGTYQWFPIESQELHTYGPVMENSLPPLHQFIDDALNQYNLDEDRLLLAGFSQGAMMAIGTALSRSNPCAGVLAYSGAFTKPTTFEVKSKPEILLVHGDEDDIVPIDYMHHTKDVFETHDIPHESMVCKGLGHSINLKGFSKGKEFVERILKDKKDEQYAT